jgi:hypothetical protein
VEVTAIEGDNCFQHTARFGVPLCVLCAATFTRSAAQMASPLQDVPVCDKIFLPEAACVTPRNGICRVCGLSSARPYLRR